MAAEAQSGAGAAPGADGLIDLTGGQPSIDSLYEDIVPPLTPRLTLSAFSDSPDQLRVSAVLTAYRGLAAALAGLATAIVAWQHELLLSQRMAMWLALSLAVAALILIAASQVHASVIRMRQSLAPSPAEDIRRPSHPELDLHGQSRANELQLRAYQELAIAQARSSFRQSQSAMTVALLILLAGGCTVISWADGDGQVVVGALTVLGSGFSAFLGKTFLDARNRSIEQLNQSYILPLSKSFLLFAHQLASGVKAADVHDQLVQSIVSTTLKAVETTQEGIHGGRRTITAAYDRRRNAPNPSGSGGAS